MSRFWLRRNAGAACVFALLVTLMSAADSDIKTPFQVVPLWSDEMMAYLTGEKQPACSGAAVSNCERLNSGICDGEAYFTTGSLTPELLKLRLYRPPSKQAGSSNPQSFGLEIRNAASASDLSIFYSPVELSRFELVFRCNISGNDACPTGRFQTGAIYRVEVAPFEGGPPVDLTARTSVGADGFMSVSIPEDVRRSFFSRPGAVYRLHAAAECFSVAPTPVQWTLPLYASPSSDGKPAGAIVARVRPGETIEFTYRAPSGAETMFEPDWTERDWGYTFLLDQTTLERRGEWFRLPPRPFPAAVWVQLPGREPSTVTPHEVYRLSKTMSVRREGDDAPIVFEAGSNVYVANVLDGALEIRKEEPFDMPCGEDAPKPPTMPTYVVDVGQFYDRDLHLRLQPAYTRGC